MLDKAKLVLPFFVVAIVNSTNNGTLIIPVSDGANHSNTQEISVGTKLQLRGEISPKPRKQDKTFSILLS